MDQNIIKIMGQTAGIGGLAIFVLLILFRDVIKKNIFPTLTRTNAYSLLRLIVILVFIFALSGIAVWAYVKVSENIINTTNKNATTTQFLNNGIPNQPQVTIDKKSLFIIKPTQDITAFTGTVKPSEFCQELQIMIKTDRGHACLSREPLCSNGNWEINCSQEIKSFKPGKYDITVRTKKSSISDTLEITDNN